MFDSSDFQGRVQPDSPVVRQGRQAIHCGVANPARRHIDDASQTHGVVRILQDAQVGDQVFDFGAVIETRATHHQVGQVVRAQGLLQHARLPVGPVEHGEIARRGSLVQPGLHGRGHVFGFLAFRLTLEHHDWISGACLGKEPLGPTLGVGRDHCIGRAQDVSRRTIVLLQLDHAGAGMIALEIEDVADVGPPPTVD